ncbi:hypothetical protein [Algoriphagus sp.]|uniref:hypothetical protein n=1 Tax=Algoriphagus sp. TaxID=1872435 RepID=UPI0025F58174|nr:hypothetical protein [Algoriphagus sp.]
MELKDKKLIEMAEKIERIREENHVEITPDFYINVIAPTFARDALRGAVKGILKLDEEAKASVFKEIGAAFSEKFAETSEKTWESDSPEVTKIALRGLFQGMLNLDEKNKRLAFRGLAEGCFHHHLSLVSPWEEAGISFEQGSHTFDSACVVLEKMLKLRTIERHGDTIFWTGEVKKRYGKCSCCIHWSGIWPEPVEEFCLCAVECMQLQFEYLTGEPVDADLVESLNHGDSDNCCFRVYTKKAALESISKEKKKVAAK